MIISEEEKNRIRLLHESYKNAPGTGSLIVEDAINKSSAIACIMSNVSVFNKEDRKLIGMVPGSCYKAIIDQSFSNVTACGLDAVKSFSSNPEAGTHLINKLSAIGKCYMDKM